MEFNKETFEKALKANKIVRYQQHFEAVVKSYLEIENQALQQTDVSGAAYRYPMTYDQPCQIDCRVISCKFYKGAGKCENVSPAITLNKNGKFVCWSQVDR